jgi:hypothetical protein
MRYKLHLHVKKRSTHYMNLNVKTQKRTYLEVGFSKLCDDLAETSTISIQS